MPSPTATEVEPTPEQRAAIAAGPEGAFLVAAGPGTGKTFTMVRRFLWLVREHGLSPDQVLAVTFTESAAAELRERLQAELGDPLDRAWIGTFHGVCSRLLQEDAYLVGVSRQLRVLDEIEQPLELKRLQGRLRSGGAGFDPTAFEALNPDEVAELVRDGPRFALGLKGRGILPEAFRARALEIQAARGAPEGPATAAEREAIDVLHAVYQGYEQWLADQELVDFDDLILRVLRALETVPGFRRRCQDRFRHVIVDEFQDTNRIQLELVRGLASDGFANVTVVGDAKQSIFGWRDAEIENIRSRFPGSRLPLTVNRRSRQEILDAATAFIRRDPDFAAEPDLVAARGAGGACVQVVMAPDPRAEARSLVAEIRRLAVAGIPHGRIAVLAHSVRHLPREFEEELRRAGVPFVTSGSSGFFDREEVKDVLALLRLVADPMDDGALVRVLQGPVVRAGDDRLYTLAMRRRDRRGMRLRDCLDEAMGDSGPELAGAVGARAATVVAALDRVSDARDSLTVADVLNRVLEDTGYKRHTQVRAAREGPRGLANLGKVARLAARFERAHPLGGIVEFVDHLHQVIDAELAIGEAEPEAGEAVRLMTIHAAKGLEFDAVFLVNVRKPRARETGRLFFDPDGFGFVMRWWRNQPHPTYRLVEPAADRAAVDLRERRRLVYVALTRARDRLYVSASREEASAAEVDVEADDHFAELLAWALANPDAARVVTAEQLELPRLSSSAAVAGPAPDLAPLLARLERLSALEARPPDAAPGPLRLSFSQLHQFEVCPLRYRFQEVWRVPAPADELLSRGARAGAGAAEMGAAVHSALAAFHGGGAALLEAYSGPPEGRRLLETYLEHPLSRAATLATEAEFNLRLGDIQLKGLVDRVAVLDDGTTVLVDYKTNARLDDRLVAAYSTQLRVYGLAAHEGLLPGGRDPRLLLFDLRRGRTVDVGPDPAGAEARVLEVAARVRAGNFELGPEHADRPCPLCAYRPVCERAL